MLADMKESGFEALIASYLTDKNGYELGKSSDYNKEYAVDEGRLFRFLRRHTTRPNGNTRHPKSNKTHTIPQ